jgi:hypothetical protein
MSGFWVRVAPRRLTATSAVSDSLPHQIAICNALFFHEIRDARVAFAAHSANRQLSKHRKTLDAIRIDAIRMTD